MEMPPPVLIARICVPAIYSDAALAWHRPYAAAVRRASLLKSSAGEAR